MGPDTIIVNAFIPSVYPLSSTDRSFRPKKIIKEILELNFNISQMDLEYYI